MFYDVISYKLLCLKAALFMYFLSVVWCWTENIL